VPVGRRGRLPETEDGLPATGAERLRKHRARVRGDGHALARDFLALYALAPPAVRGRIDCHEDTLRALGRLRGAGRASGQKTDDE